MRYLNLRMCDNDFATALYKVALQLLLDVNRQDLQTKDLKLLVIQLTIGFQGNSHTLNGKIPDYVFLHEYLSENLTIERSETPSTEDTDSASVGIDLGGSCYIWFH